MPFPGRPERSQCTICARVYSLQLQGRSPRLLRVAFSGKQEMAGRAAPIFRTSTRDSARAPCPLPITSLDDSYPGGSRAQSLQSHQHRRVTPTLAHPTPPPRCSPARSHSSCSSPRPPSPTRPSRPTPSATPRSTPTRLRAHSRPATTLRLRPSTSSQLGAKRRPAGGAPSSPSATALAVSPMFYTVMGGGGAELGRVWDAGRAES